MPLVEPSAKGAKMRVHQSLLGAILAALYLIVAVIVAYDAYGCSGGTFPLPCDFLLVVVMFPALPVIALFDKLGLSEPSFSTPGPAPSDLVMVTFYILCCAALLYLSGYAIERVCRQLVADFKRK